MSSSNESSRVPQVSSISTSRTPQNNNASKISPQEAEAKMKAAGLKHLQLRYRNWQRGQKQYTLQKEIMDLLFDKEELLFESFHQQKAEGNYAAAEETRREIQEVHEKLNPLQYAIDKSVGEEYIKEEQDADKEVFKTFKEVWTAKGCPL